MAGHDGDRRPAPAVGGRDPGVGQGGQRRRRRRDDLVADPGLGQRLGLFRPPPEDERVSALQPHDPFSLPGQGHQQGVDPLLGYRVAAGFLADVDSQAAGQQRRDHPARRRRSTPIPRPPLRPLRTEDPRRAPTPAPAAPAPRPPLPRRRPAPPARGAGPLPTARRPAGRGRRSRAPGATAGPARRCRPGRRPRPGSLPRGRSAPRARRAGRRRGRRSRALPPSAPARRSTPPPSGRPGGSPWGWRNGSGPSPGGRCTARPRTPSRRRRRRSAPGRPS